MKKHLLAVAVVSFLVTVPHLHAQWERTAGPTGGQVLKIASIDSALYVSLYGAGLYRSVDQGNSWSPINNGLTHRSVASLIAVGTDLVAATSTGGVYRSSNKGLSWSPSNTGMNATNTGPMVMVDSVLLLGSYMSTPSVYRSTDGGRTWSPSASGIVPQPSGPPAFGAMAVSNGKVFGIGNGRPYYSTDRGLTWVKLAPRLPDLDTYQSIRSNGQWVVVTGPAGVFLSTDGGTEWGNIASGLALTYSVTCVGITSKHIYIETDNACYRSPDRGVHWTPFTLGFGNDRMNVITEIGGSLFAGARTGGVFRSVDDGLSWVSLNGELVAQGISSVGIVDSWLIAGGSTAVHRSNDRGGSWTWSESVLQYPRFTCFASSDTTAFIGTFSGVYRSVDRGATWQLANTGLPAVGLLSLASGASRLFAGTMSQMGVYVSTDFGNSWNHANTSPTRLNVNSFAFIRDSIFAVSDMGMYVSVDGGSVWSLLTTPFGTGGSYQMLTTSNHTLLFNLNGNVFGSSDAGVTWSQLREGYVSGSYYPILGSGDNIFAHDSSLIVSTNMGASWVRLNSQFPRTTPNDKVTALAMDDQYLYANSVYSGVWRLPLTSLVPYPSPVIGAATDIRTTGFAVNWSAVPGVSSYRVDVARDPGFTDFVSTYDAAVAGPGTSFSVAGLKAATRYFVRVRAAGPAGTSVSSKVLPVVTAAFGSVSLAVTVGDAEDWGSAGAGARVELYNGLGTMIGQSYTNAGSVAEFPGVPEGTGYSCRVYVVRSTPWGEQFWGEMSGISVASNQTTMVNFIHCSPYIPTVKVYVDSSNVLLPEGTRTVVQPGTRLRFVLLLKNPLYPGARDVLAYAGIELDRDRTNPPDVHIVSASATMAPGSQRSVSFVWVAPDVRAPYYLSVGAFGSYDGSVYRVTDGSGWRDPVFTVGSDAVAHYPLDGDALDASGHGNDATLVYHGMYIADRFGRANSALDLNGVDSYAAFKSGTYFSGDFTFSGWCYVRNFRNYSRFLDFGNGSNSDNVILSLSKDSTGLFYAAVYRNGSSYPAMVSPSMIERNSWIHLVYVSRGGFAKMYNNGALWAEGEANVAPDIVRSKNYLGRSNWAEDQYADAAFDDIRIFPRALSESEVLALYQENGYAKEKGSLSVTVSDAEDWGPAGAGVRVELYNSIGTKVATAHTNAGSVAGFADVREGGGYFCRLYAPRNTPWGEEFWGERTGIAVSANKTTALLMTHNTPYLPAARVFIDSTNEELTTGSRRPVPPGTRLRIEVQVKNPDYPGSQQVSGYVGVYLDRDKLPPYDVALPSPRESWPNGSTKTVTFMINAGAGGGAYFLSVAAYASTRRFPTSMTNASAWIDPSFSVQTVAGPAPWTYRNTGTSHTIVIPLSADPTINGVPLAPGDYIGVFHDSSGVLSCAGYEQWTGTGSIAVPAFGDDATTPTRDGFVTGELFTWMIFRASDRTVHAAAAGYAPVGGLITDVATYAANGISQVTSLVGGMTTQSLALRSGWGIISCNIAPQSTVLDSMFRAVGPELVLLKSGNQKVYIPSVPVNGIGQWKSTEGYQVKMQTARTLTVTGPKIVPEASPIGVPQGWSIMPYLRDQDLAVASALDTLVDDIIIVKDQDGRSYIPLVGVNGIGTLKVGRGYQVKMSSERTFTYPSNFPGAVIAREAEGSDGGTTAAGAAPWYFGITGKNHTLIVPAAAAPAIEGAVLQPGDYLGVFYDSSGTLACGGCEPWTGESALGVPAFGDDPMTVAKDGFAEGERFTWKVWRQSKRKAFILRATYLPAGALGAIVADSGAYKADGLSALSRLSGGVTDVAAEDIPANFALMQNYPNPFNPATTITYGLPVASDVTLRVLNTLGQEVATLVNGPQAAGFHHVVFNGDGLSSGLYFYTIRARSSEAGSGHSSMGGGGGFTATRKLLLLR